MKQLQEIFQHRFEGWLAIQNAISRKHNVIEFRRAGTITLNLFENRLGSEKSVDVKLATDMITLEEIYEVAIIASGDQDYVPAVEVLKDCGKRVINVAFKMRSGELLPGGARKLNQVTDWSHNISYKLFQEYLQIGQLTLDQ